jgi:RNA polymerase sigma-70 factor, ECF subfamily
MSVGLISAGVLAQALSIAQQTYPSVQFVPDSYVELHQRVTEAALQSHGAEVFLAWACATGEPAALRIFDDTILAAGCDAIRTIDSNPVFVDEIRQQVRAHLLVNDGQAKISTYAGRGALQSWVGVTAVRTALMAKRSQGRKKEVSDQDWAGALSLASTGNPELDLLKRQHAECFSQALRDTALALEPRLRSLLSMHFSHGLSIDEIGASYAVHRATAARWVTKAREELMIGTKQRLIERLGISETEVVRVAALVESQIDVSLSQLFAA